MQDLSSAPLLCNFHTARKQLHGPALLTGMIGGGLPRPGGELPHVERVGYKASGCVGRYGHDER
jgi:hypothetical protein